MIPDNTLSRAPQVKLFPEPLDASQALFEGHFVPYFQPLVTLRTGQLSGFEVLARWLHPSKGVISPNDFIQIAERDGWIGAMTEQILRKAFAAAVALPDPLTLAINISPVQLREVGLPEQIRSLAAEGGFPMSRLVIEITESALIENLPSAASMVAELKRMGCRLALDDFGTGYSSLSHLQSLPFDKLKVDRSFVSSMVEKRESRKIVAAVVGLGQSLGLRTVGEGIETQEQAEMLLWLGCDLGQGFLYGHPMPVEDLPACLAAKREKLLVPQGSAWKRISASNLDTSPTQRLAQLQAVYDGAPVGLAFLDQNLRYVNLNQRLAEMNGAPVEEHLGAPVSAMVPTLFPYVEPFIRRALAGEAVMDLEARMPDKDQTRLISYQPARDEAGEVVGVSIAIVDITERKRTEEALKQSEAHYRSMVELNPQVLWIMDPQGRNLDVSPRWDKKTGQMKSQATEHDWLRLVHPADIQPTVRAIAKSRRGGSPIDVQYRVSDEQGNWRWKRSRGSPRFDADGNIVCWYGSVEEIEAPTPASPVSVNRDPAPRNFSKAARVVRALPDVKEESRRLQALREMEILDTPAEAEFDDLVALAAEICSAPISLLSLVDADRQWFKASVGITASETDIESSFCVHVIRRRGLFVIEDASKDKRFRCNSLVVGQPHIRFYAGLPIYAEKGYGEKGYAAGGGFAIGALCVIDTVPRSLSRVQVKGLTTLSHQIQALLKLRGQRWRDSRSVLAGREPASVHLCGATEHASMGAFA